MIIEYLHRRYYEPRGLDMRACHPRDLVEQVVDMCRYQNKPPHITRELLDHACRNYFLEEQASKQTARARGALRRAGGRPPCPPAGVRHPALAAHAPQARSEEWLS